MQKARPARDGPLLFAVNSNYCCGWGVGFVGATGVVGVDGIVGVPPIGVPPMGVLTPPAGWPRIPVFPPVCIIWSANLL